MSEIKKINYIIIFSLIFTILLNRGYCLANTSTDEEKQFTGVEELDPGKIDQLNGRSYDEAITIQDIKIKGNSLLSQEKILNELQIKPGSKFNRDLIKEDLKTLYNMGYFTEKMKAVPEPSPSGITLYIEVEENVPVTGFNIVGNHALKTEEIISIVEEQTGLPQNLTKLNQDIDNIEKVYADKGYILARVKSVSDDPDGVITIKINEGVIDDIELTGNVKTKDYVIKRNLTVQKGEIYNEIKLKQDMARIFGTQAFSDVRRVISPSVNNPDKYNLTIEVDEKRTGSISLGGGLDTYTGLFGQAGYMDNNFLGRGQEISTNFTVGSGTVFSNRDVLDRADYQFDAHFIEPRLMQSLNSLQLNIFARDMASYQIPLSVERRIGTSIEVARPLKQIKNLAGSVSLGFENTEIKEGDESQIRDLFNNNNIDISKRAEQLKGGSFITLGPSIVYDSRNSLLLPTQGWYASARLNQYFATFGSEAETFGKGTVSVRKYIPIGEKSTFIIGGKAGSSLIGDVPEFETFRLGGPYTIRGFWEGDVGNGQGFMMSTVEFRTPLPLIDKLLNYKIIKDIRLALFMDAGTLFEETITNDLYNYPGYAMSMGVGVIVPLPFIGPVRLDYGYPLTSVGSGNRKGRFTPSFGERY